MHPALDAQAEGFEVFHAGDCVNGTSPASVRHSKAKLLPKHIDRLALHLAWLFRMRGIRVCGTAGLARVLGTRA